MYKQSARFYFDLNGKLKLRFFDSPISEEVDDANWWLQLCSSCSVNMSLYRCLKLNRETHTWRSGRVRSSPDLGPATYVPSVPRVFSCSCCFLFILPTWSNQRGNTHAEMGRMWVVHMDAICSLHPADCRRFPGRLGNHPCVCECVFTAETI